MKQKVYFLALLVLTVWVEGGCRRPTSTANAVLERAGPPRKILPVQVDTGEVVRWVEVTAEVKPGKRAELGARVSGRVARILKDVGDSVKKGDVILELDREETEIMLEQAKAALAQAEANLQKALAGPRPQELREAEAAYEQAKNDFERAESLLKEGAISQQAYDALKSAYIRARERLDLLKEGTRKEEIEADRAAVQVAQSQLERAVWMLREASIRAPFDGKLSARFVEVGDYVNAQMTSKILQVDSLDPLKITIQLPFSDIRHLQKGVSGIFTLGSDPSQSYPVVVERLAPSADSVGLYLVELLLQGNAQTLLKPGATGKLRLPVEKVTALRIPLSSALQREGKWFVFVLKDNTVHRTEIQVGLRGKEYLQVLSGVSEGQTLAGSQVDLLQDGEKVEISPDAMKMESDSQ